MIIYLDGIDGAGKSTQVKYLQLYLLSEGYVVKVLKPFYFTRFVFNRFGNMIRKLTNAIKQTEMYEYKQHLYLYILKNLIKAFGLTAIIITHFLLEILLCKIIYEKNIIIIYDRFYFDKLVPRSKMEYKLYYSILKHIIKGYCVILDVPISIAYKRMRDIHDKLMPKQYFITLRKWYRIWAKLLGCLIIDTSKTSPIKTHSIITLYIECLLKS